MVVPSSFCLEQPILFPAEEEFEEATGNGLESLLEELLKGSLKVQVGRIAGAFESSLGFLKWILLR
jgi:hypothetical protein